MEGEYKSLKREIMCKLDELYKKSELHLLSHTENELKLVLDSKLKKLLRDEQIKWI